MLSIKIDIGNFDAHFEVSWQSRLTRSEDSLRARTAESCANYLRRPPGASFSRRIGFLPGSANNSWRSTRDFGTPKWVRVMMEIIYSTILFCFVTERSNSICGE